MTELFKTGIGIITFYVALAIAIYVLQAIPFTGIVLMLFAGPFWIGVLTHTLMLHLTVMAVPGWISRGWLLAPLCYYAGGYILHLDSIRRAEAQVAALEKVNEAATVRANRPFTYMARYAHEDALFLRYDVERAFFAEAGKTFTQYEYARGNDCDKARSLWSYQHREQPYLRHRDLFPAYYASDKVRQCAISKVVPTGDWQYRLESTKISIDKGLFTINGTRWEVFDDRAGTHVTSAIAASIAVLPVVQTPIAGCWLISSGTPQWKCAASLVTSSETLTVGYRKRELRRGENPFTLANEPGTEPVSVLGRVLSLDPRRPNS